jgi:hypothetical protein
MQEGRKVQLILKACWKKRTTTMSTAHDGINAMMRRQDEQTNTFRFGPWVSGDKVSDNGDDGDLG